MNGSPRHFQFAKHDDDPAKSQDAWGADEARGIYAVADGATVSILQREWADILVRQFVAEPPEEGKVDGWIRSWLNSCREMWQVNADATSQNRSWLTQDLVEYDGAAAAFIGVRLLPTRGRWIGVAVGDCNVFQFGTGGALKSKGPMDTPAAFTSSPHLLRSIGVPDEAPAHSHLLSGTYEPGDVFVLASDAVAKWVLLECGRGGHALAPVLDPHEDISQLVERIREDRDVPTDDLTMVVFPASGVGSSAPPVKPQPGTVSPLADASLQTRGKQTNSQRKAQAKAATGRGTLETRPAPPNPPPPLRPPRQLDPRPPAASLRAVLGLVAVVIVVGVTSAWALGLIGRDGISEPISRSTSSDSTRAGAAPDRPEAGPCGEAYVVEAGDSFSQIAERCQVREAALTEANPDVRGRQNDIKPGETLNIPPPATRILQAETDPTGAPQMGGNTPGSMGGKQRTDDRK